MSSQKAIVSSRKATVSSQKTALSEDCLELTHPSIPNPTPHTPRPLQKPTAGLSDLPLDPSVLAKLSTEDDLNEVEEALRGQASTSKGKGGRAPAPASRSTAAGYGARDAGYRGCRVQCLIPRHARRGRCIEGAGG